MEFMRRRHACVKKEGLTNRQKLEQEELNEYIAAILTLQDSIDATGNFHVHYREVMSEKQREAQRAAEMRSSDPRPKAQNRTRRMDFKMPSDDEDLEHAIASSLEDKAMCRTIEFDNHEVDRAILECLQVKHHQNLLQPVSGREKEDLKRALRESKPTEMEYRSRTASTSCSSAETVADDVIAKSIVAASHEQGMRGCQWTSRLGTC